MSSADCYSTKFININHLFVFSFILFLFKQTALYNFSVAFNTNLYAFYTQNKLREANKLLDTKRNMRGKQTMRHKTKYETQNKLRDTK